VVEKIAPTNISDSGAWCFTFFMACEGGLPGTRYLCFDCGDTFTSTREPEKEVVTENFGPIRLILPTGTGQIYDLNQSWEATPAYWMIRAGEIKDQQAMNFVIPAPPITSVKVAGIDGIGELEIKVI